MRVDPDDVVGVATGCPGLAVWTWLLGISWHER